MILHNISVFEKSKNLKFLFQLYKSALVQNISKTAKNGQSKWQNLLKNQLNFEVTPADALLLHSARYEGGFPDRHTNEEQPQQCVPWLPKWVRNDLESNLIDPTITRYKPGWS